MQVCYLYVKAKNKEWIIVADTYNSCTNGEKRDAHQLKHLWQNMKEKARKASSEDKVRCLNQDA